MYNFKTSKAHKQNNAYDTNMIYGKIFINIITKVYLSIYLYIRPLSP